MKLPLEQRGFAIYDADGHVVAAVESLTGASQHPVDKEALQDLGTIVKAVNLHEELVASLKTLCDGYKAEEMVATWMEGTERHDFWKAALDVLAKTEAP